MNFGISPRVLLNNEISKVVWAIELMKNDVPNLFHFEFYLYPKINFPTFFKELFEVKVTQSLNHEFIKLSFQWYWDLSKKESNRFNPYLQKPMPVSRL